MAIQITSPAGPSAVSISSKTTPSISHLDMVVAGTEYTLSIPIGVKSFSVIAEQVSGAFPRLKVATGLGDTATDDNYPVYGGNSWDEDLLSGTSGLTLYVSSNKANTVLKILTWT